jgi:putative pyruvate formate lyase activating enzyme
MIALHRVQLAREMLRNCRLCAYDCGTNRFLDISGRCHAGTVARFFCAQTEVTDELMLIPAFNVALSGCDLRCDFCITGAPSWNSALGQSFDPKSMAMRATQALNNGARCVMVLGGEPTIHLPSVLEFVAELPAAAKLVWKTNGHCSEKARKLLEGIFDVWVADFKFGNDHCAERLAKVKNYVQVVRANLSWAFENSELIVRHLLMPGHIECCWKPVAEWVAAELPGVKVSLRTGFWPAWHANRHLELQRTLASTERREAFQLANELKLNLIP